MFYIEHIKGSYALKRDDCLYLVRPGSDLNISFLLNWSYFNDTHKKTHTYKHETVLILYS